MIAGEMAAGCLSYSHVTGAVLDVGRSRRLVTQRQSRALQLRERGCAHPGCGPRYGLEAHHVVHRLDGGGTDMANNR